MLCTPYYLLDMDSLIPTKSHLYKRFSFSWIVLILGLHVIHPLSFALLFQIIFTT